MILMVYLFLVSFWLAGLILVVLAFHTKHSRTENNSTSILTKKNSEISKSI